MVISKLSLRHFGITVELCTGLTLDRHGNPLPTTSAPSAPTMADTISSIEKEEAALEELFARLNSPSLPSTPQPVLKASNKNAIDLANCGADNTNPSKQFSPGVKVEQSIASRAHIANKNADSTNASLPFPPSTQMEKPPKVGAMSIKEEADGNTPLQTIPAKSDLKDPLPKKTEKGTGETVIGRSIRAGLLNSTIANSLKMPTPRACLHKVSRSSICIKLRNTSLRFHRTQAQLLNLSKT